MVLDAAFKCLQAASLLAHQGALIGPWTVPARFPPNLQPMALASYNRLRSVLAIHPPQTLSTVSMRHRNLQLYRSAYHQLPSLSPPIESCATLHPRTPQMFSTPTAGLHRGHQALTLQVQVSALVLPSRPASAWTSFSSRRILEYSEAAPVMRLPI